MWENNSQSPLGPNVLVKGESLQKFQAFFTHTGVPGGPDRADKPNSRGLWKCENCQKRQLLKICKIHLSVTSKPAFSKFIYCISRIDLFGMSALFVAWLISICFASQGKFIRIHFNTKGKLAGYDLILTGINHWTHHHQHHHHHHHCHLHHHHSSIYQHVIVRHEFDFALLTIISYIEYWLIDKCKSVPILKVFVNVIETQFLSWETHSIYDITACKINFWDEVPILGT